MPDPAVPTDKQPDVARTVDDKIDELNRPSGVELCAACKHPKHVGRVCGFYDGTKPVAPCMCDDVHARKADNGKTGGFSLIPWNVIHGLAAIYDYGRKKYAANSWQTVPPDKHGRTAEERYEDAMFRHWKAHKSGEVLDPESGLPHLYHFLWGAVAICWFNDKKMGWKL